MAGLYHTGVAEHTMNLQFQNVAEGQEWGYEVLEIKAFIADIENVDNDAQRRPLYIQWRGMVLKFAEHWGGHRVPRDIKDALNSVEVGVGLPTTNW